MSNQKVEDKSNQIFIFSTELKLMTNKYNDPPLLKSKFKTTLFSKNNWFWPTFIKVFDPKPTKTNLPNQTYQTKPTKQNLPNKTYQTKPTKPNLPNQTYLTKITGQSSQRLGP